MKKQIKHLVLIDGSSYIFRAYYALPPMTTSQGVPVNAVFGFCNMLLKQLENIQIEKGGNVSVAVVFDAARKTFRNEIYPDYKANRSDAPDDLIPQFKIIKEIPEIFNLKSIESIGYEADDLIASYAVNAEKMGIKVTIISSDKDLMQILNNNILMLDPLKNREIGKDDVFKKFGVFPKNVIDVQALAGDSSDNVPGVPGIGVKTAASLINEFGNLENLLKNAHKIKQLKRRESLLNNFEVAMLSKKLVTLKNDIILPIDIEELGFVPIDIDKIVKFLDQMEFKRIKTQIIQKYGKKEKNSNGNEKSENIPSLVVDNETDIDRKNYQLISDEHNLKKWIDIIIDQGVVAIDCETNSLSPTLADIVGFSMSIDKGLACYIPINHKNDGGDLKQISREQFITLIKVIMEDSSILKIGQNIKYDLIILDKLGIKVNNVDDTMLMSYVLNAGKHKHGLNELAKIYLSHNTIHYEDVVGKGKDKKSFDMVSLEKAKEYAAEDADVTYRLWNILKRKLIEKKLFSFYFYIERPLVGVIKKMEIAGISVNFDFLKNLSVEFTKQLSQLEKKIFEISKEEFNIGSPKQLGEILFEKLKLPFGKKGKSGNYQTDVSILEKLKNNKLEIADYLLSWRQINKLISTYCEGLILRKNPHSQRVHTSFGMASTLTGRLSSNDPNLQNIPIKTIEGKKIRKAFICGKNKKIVSIDYSQIELRILAHVANIRALKGGFASGADIHSITAQDVFQVSEQNVTDDLRRKAKTINFGIIYGISAFGLASQLDISNSEAKNYIEKYFQQYPGIKNYMEETIIFCRDKGFVETLFGRRIHIPFIREKSGVRKSFAERSAINAPIQGGAADMIKRAMVKVNNFIEENKLETKMLLQVHDELIFEIPDKEMDSIPKKIAEIMENAFKPHINFSVPLIAEIGSGLDWSVAH